MNAAASLRRKITLQANSRGAETLSEALKTIKARTETTNTLVSGRLSCININYGSIPPDLCISPEQHIKWSNMHQYFATKPCHCIYCTALQERVYSKIMLHRAKKKSLYLYTQSQLDHLRDEVLFYKEKLKGVKRQVINGSFI